MKLKRRGSEAISVAFLDVITCGFGAIILLLMIAQFGDPPEPEHPDDPRIGKISALQRSLFDLQRQGRELEGQHAARAQQLSTWDAEQRRLGKQLADTAEHAALNRDSAARNAQIFRRTESRPPAIKRRNAPPVSTARSLANGSCGWRANR